MTRSEKFTNLFNKRQRLVFYTKIIPLLRTKFSIFEISKYLGKSSTTIRSYIKKFGSNYDKATAQHNGEVNRHTKNVHGLKFIEKMTFLHPKIIDMINIGLTKNEIAKTINIQPKAIDEILKRKGEVNYKNILIQNGIRRKRKTIIQNQIKIKHNKKSPEHIDVRVLKKKKYIPLLIKLIKFGFTAGDICYFFQKRNLNYGYYTTSTLLNIYGNKGLKKRLKINSMISNNKYLFAQGYDVCKKRTSKAEIKFRDIIKEYLPQAKWQYELKLENKTYNIDVALPEIQIAFEYDGSYWHEKNKERDNKRDLHFSKFGWKTIRFVYKSNPSKKRMIADILNCLEQLDLIKHPTK